MKMTSEQTVRSKTVENVPASLRMAQLTLTDSVVKGLIACSG